MAEHCIKKMVHNLEKAMHAIGFINTIIEVIFGGAPRHYYKVIKAYIEAHKQYLIEDGNGRIFPTGFNIAIMDNMNAVSCRASTHGGTGARC